MTTDVASRPVSRAQLDWLRRELPLWQAEGVLDADQGAAILGRYHATPDPERRFSLARLLLSLGAVFVGVGLIWLVAANLDQLPRCSASARRRHLAGPPRRRRGAPPPPPVAPVPRGRGRPSARRPRLRRRHVPGRPVPAGPGLRPALVGLWGAGALVQAYAVRATGPLLVGIAAGTGWFVWQTLLEPPSVLAGILCSGRARSSPRRSGPSTTAATTASPHPGVLSARCSRWPRSSRRRCPSSTPATSSGTSGWSAAWSSPGSRPPPRRPRAGLGRLEPLGAVVVAPVSLGLVLWDAGADASDALTVADWAHAAVSVAAYAGLAVGIAALGGSATAGR